MSGLLKAVPVTLRKACAFVAQHHRHNLPPRGHRFSIGCTVTDRLVGVAIVGRPVSRNFNHDEVAEVIRVCVLADAPKGTCSFLYGACWRAWRAMGGIKMITYTLQQESGASMRGAGWLRAKNIDARDAGGWTNRGKGRLVQDVVSQPKIRWEIART